jgi:glycosidase
MTIMADISNYRAIMKDFGTMEDFDKLLKECMIEALN